MAKEEPAGPTSFAEYVVDTKAFEELDHGFHAIIQELMGDNTLERFREEYERLHRALRRACDSNKRLVAKCSELDEEIATNTAKVDRALELLQQDRRTIAALRGEIDKAWKMVEAAQGREKKADETIESLKAEISHLTHLVEQGGLLSYGHDNQVRDLLQHREQLLRERDAQLAQIDQLRKEHATVTEQHQKTKQDKAAMDQRVQHLRGVLGEKRAQVESELLHRERLQKQLQSLRMQLQSVQSQIESQETELAKQTAEEERLAQSIADTKAQVRDLRAQNAESQKREEELDRQIEEENEQNRALSEETHALDERLREREREIRTLKNEIDRRTRENHTLQQNIAQTRHMCAQDQAEVAALRAEVAGMEKEIAELQRGIAANQKEREQLEARKKALDGSIKQSKERLEHQQALTAEEAAHRKELEKKLIQYQDESQRMRREIDDLEKRREHCAREAAEAQVRFIKAKEDAKMSEIQLAHTQRLVTAAEEELKQKQSQYEQLRVERNQYNRKLVQAQDANVELKQRFKAMTQQAQQLKTEIRSKEETLASERFELRKAGSRKEKLEREKKRLQDEWAAAEATMLSHQKELEALEARIRETDTEREKLLADQLTLMKDRDILGTQLIRRNDEIALLQEKIKILQDTLRNGEAEFRKRQEEAAELKRLIADSHRRILILQRQCDETAELESRVRVLQKDLQQEQTRVRALSEELEDPNNPHRWRHLYGEDPAPAELLKTIRQLQRRLIGKTEEIVNTKKEIARLRAQAAGARQALEDEPSPEMLHQLKDLQLKVRAKDRQLKAMAAELNSQQAKLADYQGQCEALQEQMSEARQRQFAHRKVLGPRSTGTRSGVGGSTSRSAAGSREGGAPGAPE